MKWDAFAVQAVVMVAACHNRTLVTEYSVEQVVQQLGTWWQNVSKALEQEKDSMFKPSPRKKCKDCVFEESQVCVLWYCHSDQGPNVDSYWVKMSVQSQGFRVRQSGVTSCSSLEWGQIWATIWRVPQASLIHTNHSRTCTVWQLE